MSEEYCRYCITSKDYYKELLEETARRRAGAKWSKLVVTKQSKVVKPSEPGPSGPPREDVNQREDLKQREAAKQHKVAKRTNLNGAKRIKVELSQKELLIQAKKEMLQGVAHHRAGVFCRDKRSC